MNYEKSWDKLKTYLKMEREAAKKGIESSMVESVYKKKLVDDIITIMRKLEKEEMDSEKLSNQ